MIKKHYPSEDEWGLLRIREVDKLVIENYVAKHQVPLNKKGIYSIPAFAAYAIKKYMGENK